MLARVFSKIINLFINRNFIQKYFLRNKVLADNGFGDEDRKKLQAAFSDDEDEDE